MKQQVFSALVVDDERPVRELTARMLGGQGFRCDLACDGDEAVACLDATRYDVVVTDLCMPNRHGHELCVQILARDDRPAVVVLTGLLEPRLANDLCARGVDEICYKPVDYARFAARVRDLAEEHRGRRSAELAEPGAELAESGAEPAESGVETAEPSARTTESAVAAPDSEPAPPRDGCAERSSVIAILLADRGRSDRLAELLADAPHGIPVSSSDDLCDLIRRRPVDLIVIEQQLSGFFTGLEILERLSRDLLGPPAVLLDASASTGEEQAALAGVELVATDGDVARLAETVRAVLRKLRSESGLVPRQVRTVVDRLPIVPFLPQLLVRLAAYLDMPIDEIPLQELAREIAVDPRATSELLKLTNSASTGLPRRVTSVFEAVTLHGAPRTISLLFSLATLEMHADLLKQCPVELREWCQSRSVLIASAASTFAARLENVSTDTAFILGLLQETGVLALASVFPRRYRSILQRVQRVGQLQLCALEAADLQFTHAHVSAALLDRWGLPPSLIRPVLGHHDQDGQKDRSTTEQSYLRVMRIGEAVADLVDVPHPARRARLNGLLNHYPDCAADCRDSLLASISAAAESCRMFSLPAPAESVLRKLLQQVVPSQG